MSKIEPNTKTKNLIAITAITAIAALSSTAIATAADSPAQGPPVPTASARGAAVAHGPIGVRPSTPVALKIKAERLRERKAEAKRRAEANAVPSGPVAGVSQSTLDAIAACESGGDPAAVNAGGYYGKYQFDLGTWASVGGSGNPAEASEGEQDYRASVLYSRAGASPWPVCGQ